MSYPRYQGDPYWTEAHYFSTCSRCGRHIRAGEQIFYYPKGRRVYCDAPGCGVACSAEFTAAAEDEAFMSGQSY